MNGLLRLPVKPQIGSIWFIALDMLELSEKLGVSVECEMNDATWIAAGNVVRIPNSGKVTTYSKQEIIANCHKEPE